MDVEESETSSSNLLERGTFHQDALAAKKGKTGFLLSPNPDYANTVHDDAATVVFSKEAEVCTFSYYPSSYTLSLVM